MAISLNSTEQRVLGVLIEKSLAVPAYYPLTLNAVLAACNQKSNRDPVMELTEGEVATALHSLRQWQLVSQAPPDRNSRSNRFQHEAEARFGWNAAQRALMAELLLRGPQTLGELKTRASRMTHLESMDYAHDLLKELMRTDPPQVVERPRYPGQSTTRFAQLLGDAPPAPAVFNIPTIRPSPAAAPSSDAALEPRVCNLERQLAELQEELRSIRDRLG